MMEEHSIPWQDLPGYRVLLKSFLVELKNREILKYPVTLKQAAANILLNEKLLNVFVTLIYNKTKFFACFLLFFTLIVCFKYV